MRLHWSTPLSTGVDKRQTPDNRRSNLARPCGDPKRQLWIFGRFGRASATRTSASSGPSPTRPPGCRDRVDTRSLGESSCAAPTRNQLAARSLYPASLRRPGPRGGRREAYVSAQQPPPCQEARLSCSDEHSVRPRRVEEPPRQGPRPSVGLIARIRGRHDFARLARDGTRIRCSALWCTWCPEPDSTSTRVAFAISRAYGPAVRRNRLRRRLRAVLTELDRIEPLPPGMLLVGPRPRQDFELTFDQVRTELSELLRRIRTSEARPCST